MALAGSCSIFPAPPTFGLREVRLAADAIRKRADVDANVIFGATFSESLAKTFSSP